MSSTCYPMPVPIVSGPCPCFSSVHTWNRRSLTRFTWKLLANVTPRKVQKRSRVEFAKPAVQIVINAAPSIDTEPVDLQRLPQPRSRPFELTCFNGSSCAFVCDTFVFNAIQYDQPAALEVLLDHRAPRRDRLEDVFFPGGPFGRLEHYTLLTTAVEPGRAACVKVLLKYAEQKDITEVITSPDRGGGSATQLARSCVGAIHPRGSDLKHKLANQAADMLIPAEHDAAALSLPEAALADVEPENSSARSIESSLIARTLHSTLRNASAC